MIYLSAQPAEFYFKWQIEVMLNNFKRLGIEKQDIHILFGYYGTIDIRISDLLKKYTDDAQFYFYEDTRIKKGYVSSIRPHIIGKHFDFFPELEFEDIFYHDVDIIFRELPAFQNLLSAVDNKTWILSDSNSYIGIDVLNLFSTDIIHDLCKIVKVNTDQVFKNYNSFGGAQHILRRVNYDFWLKHESDCEAIYSFLSENLEVYKNQRIKSGEQTLANSTIDFKYLQAWCSDMWSLLLNAHLFGYKIEISEELNFCWPYQPLEKWYETKILHNAGVEKHMGNNLFYKGFYKEYSPFESRLDFVDDAKCSIKYIEEIRDTIKNRRYINNQCVFLFLVGQLPPEEYTKLKAAIKYISKYFKASIVLWEIAQKQTIQWEELTEEILEYKFTEDKRTNSNKLDYLNQFLSASTFEKVIYVDYRIICPVDSIIECIEKTGNDFTLGLPCGQIQFAIDSKIDLKDFYKNLDSTILEKSVQGKTGIKITDEIFIINRQKYLENFPQLDTAIENATSNSYFKLKILTSGDRVFRTKNKSYCLL